MAYANLTDVSARLGRPITDSAEIEQVNAWLSDVEILISARIPDLMDRVAAGLPSSAVVAMVEANAVVRKVRNPEGKVAERIDDYDYRYNENSGRGELFLTDEEWALLSPGAGEGAFTIRPYRADSRAGQWVHPDVWVPAP